MYKRHIHVILNRKNSVNGRAYKDDPTIMAWNLANELRCKSCGSNVMHEWIADMCSYIKEIDPTHLIGIGYEGFYGPNSPKITYNPSGGWAHLNGQDFVENSKIWCVDYAGIHVWPDDWNEVSTDFQQQYILQHMYDAEDMNKPLVLEEYGKIGPYTIKFPYFRGANQLVENSAINGDALRGSLFYHWYDNGIGPGKYGVHSHDADGSKTGLFLEIERHAERMASISKCAHDI